MPACQRRLRRQERHERATAVRAVQPAGFVLSMSHLPQLDRTAMRGNIPNRTTAVRLLSIRDAAPVCETEAA